MKIPVKLLCENCKYLSHNFFDHNLITCEKKYHYSHVGFSPIDGSKKYKEEKVVQRHPIDRNVNFNCKYYERKWYKFWIKK